MRFGVSTHLYHGRRLERAHLAQVAGYGFEAIELFATRSHFDYHDETAVGRLGDWLSEAGLALHGIHAPITDRFADGQWGSALSNAATDGARRQDAVREALTALQIARRIPFDVMVVHVGTPAGKETPADNNRGAAVRSIEELCRAAEPLGIRVALEVIPNALSTAAALVSLLERDLDAPASAGICLDFGHAFLQGDVPDAIETAAEHLFTTHVHDNHGREDEHLVPYRGSIEWDAALIAMQKIGYEGIYLMELADTGSAAAVLEEARRARQRFERALQLP